MTTFGFTVSQRASLIGGESLRELIAIGAEADEVAEIDAVWVGDSLTTKPRPDAIVALSALAATTQRVRLGIACMATFAVRDPLEFAIQWASLDRLSEGRTLLAVCNGIQKGGGASAREGGYFGGVADAERPARIEEYIPLVRRLWSGERVDHEGRFRTYRDLEITPAIQQPPPVWIAGMPAWGTAAASRFFDRVARLADGYMITTRSPALIDRAREELAAAQHRQGLAERDIPIAVYTGIAVGDDREALRDEAATFLNRYYAGASLPPAAIDTMGALGSADECVEQLAPLVDAGVAHIALRLVSFRARAQFATLAADVLPALAVRAGAIVPAGANP